MYYPSQFYGSPTGYTGGYAHAAGYHVPFAGTGSAFGFAGFGPGGFAGRPALGLPAGFGGRFPGGSATGYPGAYDSENDYGSYYGGRQTEAYRYPEQTFTDSPTYVLNRHYYPRPPRPVFNLFNINILKDNFINTGSIENGISPPKPQCLTCIKSRVTAPDDYSGRYPEIGKTPKNAPVKTHA